MISFECSSWDSWVDASRALRASCDGDGCVRWTDEVTSTWRVRLTNTLSALDAKSEWLTDTERYSTLSHITLQLIIHTVISSVSRLSRSPDIVCPFATYQHDIFSFITSSICYLCFLTKSYINCWILKAFVIKHYKVITNNTVKSMPMYYSFCITQIADLHKKMYHLIQY